MNHSLSAHECPQHVQLLAFAEGSLSAEDTQVVETHVAECDACDARLADMEEQSDTLIRALAQLPASGDDETTFRRLQAELLAAPQAFSGDTATTVAVRETLPLGVLLPFRIGNYELLEQIGAGAHGAVFRARHCRLEREVAVKLLLQADGESVQDFLHEMRVVGQLDHPNIVRATDAGEHEGLYFLVMEFIPGLDVSSLLRKVGPLSVANACEIIRQTALGLEVAHEHRLIHRDVKTSNLLFTSAGQVKLLDLGLATFTAVAGTAQPTGPRGTADYMSPEQWAGTAALAPTADIYSLGCTFFKLLTGAAPFRTLPAGFRSKQMAHEQAEPPRLTDCRDDIPPALEQFLASMLAKQVSDRPESASAVADFVQKYSRENDLTRLAAQVFPGVPRPPAPARPLVSRRLLIAAGGVAACAAAVAWWPRRSSPTLRRLHWRTLQPADPAIVPLAEQSGTYRDHQGGFELTSEAPVLFQFGHPVAKSLRLRMTLERSDWSGGAGMFFALRRDLEPQPTLRYFTLERETLDDGEARLRWVQYSAVEDQQLAPVLLAETPLREGNVQAVCTIDVTLGRQGFPEVRVNDRPYPQTEWVTSAEARGLVTASVDQLPVTYSGRIGVYQRAGRTAVSQVQLMYLRA